MQFLALFLLLAAARSIVALTIAECENGITLNEKTFYFQSPDYPASLSDEGFMCNLRIEHPNESNANCNQDGSDGDANVLDQTSAKICQVIVASSCIFYHNSHKS